MRKNEIQLLNNIQKAKPNNDLFLQTAKTPQQNFLITFAAIYFVRSGHILPTVQKLLTVHNGTFSQNMLTFQYMKHCLGSDIPLNDQEFRVYGMVHSWMKKVDKLKKNENPRLLPSVLQSQPGKLPLNHYAQLIIYFSCISRDLISFLKSPAKLLADDLLQLFGVLLPRLHYNIILPQDETKGKETAFNDILFTNQQIDYFVRTCSPYRMLVRKMFRVLLNLQLKSSQQRQLVELACRYYLLFCHNKNQKAEELFLQTFQKASEPVRFSLSNELVLFFKVARKLGEANLQKLACEKWGWVGSLVQQFKQTMVGHNKQEVSPYNPLGVQQVINVGAGKINIRTIQIYHQNSLFYFQLGIESRDINMKVYYLGDFQSKVEIRKLLLTEQKLNDTVKSAFVATKRGLYQVELDNSYSWVYAKNIKFQYVILAPHNHKSDYVWIDQLLETSFQVQDQEEIQSSEEEEKQEQSNQPIQNKQTSPIKVPNTEFIQSRQLQAKSKKYDKQDEIVANPNFKSPQKLKNDLSLKVEWGHANLSLIDGIFSLLVNTADHSYEFETDREESITKKLQGCIEAEQQLQWILNGQAREWLYRRGYSLASKSGALVLMLPGGSKIEKSSKLLEVFKYRS